MNYFSRTTTNPRTPQVRAGVPVPDEEQIRRIIESYAIAEQDADVIASPEQSANLRPVKSQSLFTNSSTSQFYTGYSTIQTNLTALSASPVTMSKHIQIRLDQLIPPDVIAQMAAAGAYQFNIGDLKIAQLCTPNSTNVSGILETNLHYADELTRYVQRIDEEQAIDLEIELAPLPIDTNPNTMLGKISYKLYDGQISGSHERNTSEQMRVYMFVSVQAQFDINVQLKAKASAKAPEVTKA